MCQNIVQRNQYCDILHLKGQRQPTKPLLLHGYSQLCLYMSQFGKCYVLHFRVQYTSSYSHAKASLHLPRMQMLGRLGLHVHELQRRGKCFEIFLIESLCSLPLSFKQHLLTNIKLTAGKKNFMTMPITQVTYGLTCFFPHRDSLCSNEMHLHKLASFHGAENAMEMLCLLATFLRL